MGNKRKPRKIVIPAPGKSLYDTHRKVAKEWHPTLNDTLTPKMVSTFSNREVWWQCSIDERHVWKAVIARRSGGAKCGVCTNRVIIPGVNDLASQKEYAHIVNEWHPDNEIKPTQVTVNSQVNILWKCSVNPNHVWSTRLPNRTRLKSGCPECVKLIKRKPKTSAPLTEYPHLIDRVRGRNCPTCASTNFAPKGEQEIADTLKVLLGDEVAIERHVRNIPRVPEVDIYLPEKKVAIEFNGVYWNSDQFKTNDYHAEKSQSCAEKGIHLIHVWEDDWRDRRDIVVRSIAHRLNATDRLNEPGVLLVPDESLTQRYGARTLVPGVITTAESIAFLEQNHIQGKANGTLHTGLRDKEGILRAVFVAKRIGNKGHEGTWRIERYATRGLVPGGFTKLMKFTQAHIQTNNLGDLTQWVTFSDGALSDGGLYRNYGFEEDGFVRPDYMYVVNGQRVHKFNYRLKRFRDDPDLEYNADMSERELALLNKIPRIWDSGKTRWVKTVK